MPRTKLSKNAAAKRNRDSTHEERIVNCLLDFDTLGIYSQFFQKQQKKVKTIRLSFFCSNEPLMQFFFLFKFKWKMA